MLAPHLREDVSRLVDQQDVDVRVDVDEDLGELRSSLPSERVFAALLVPDPDGFLNP